MRKSPRPGKREVRELGGEMGLERRGDSAKGGRDRGEGEEPSMEEQEGEERRKEQEAEKREGKRGKQWRAEN